LRSSQNRIFTGISTIVSYEMNRLPQLLAMERRNQERALKSRGPGGSVARPAPSVDPGAGEPLSVFALCFGKP